MICLLYFENRTKTGRAVRDGKRRQTRGLLHRHTQRDRTENELSLRDLQSA